jgi:hypothetical protein
MVCHKFRQRERHIPILLGATPLLGAYSTLSSSGATVPKVLRTSAEDKQLGLSVVEVGSLAKIPPVEADKNGSLPEHIDVLAKEKRD